MSEQRFTLVRSATFTGTSVNVAAPVVMDGNYSGGRVYITTPTTNKGTITLSDGTNPGGAVLGAGIGQTTPMVDLGLFQHVNFMYIQFSVVGDVLNLLVLS